MRPLSEIKGFGPARLQALAAADILTAEDVLDLLPVGYRDTRAPLSPAQLEDGVNACFEGFVIGKPTLIRKGRMQWVSAVIGDECGKIRCLWFNQVWMRDQLHDTQHVVLYGKAVKKKNGRFVINPVMEEAGKITPVYRAIPGIGQKLLRDTTRLLLEEEDIPEILPGALISRLEMMPRGEALREVHFPTDMDRLREARERLSMEELLLFQAAVLGQRGGRRRAMPLVVGKDWLDRFYASLPYEPTGAQKRAVAEIAADLQKTQAMARMVQGDVGCGKTLIAFCALYLTAMAGGQGALMAPTEILAEQHLQSAMELLRPLGITCGLLHGKMSAAEKRRAHEAIASGEWQVVVGTHALISESVEYAALRLVVTDEQHRFGARQRTALEEKGLSPHVLVMSATPIPRSLSLVLYGDLDLSVIDELPPGRQAVQTRIVPEEKRPGLYDFIRKEAAEGRQTYVVCPLIGGEDGAAAEQRSATEVLRELQAALQPLRVAMVHGRMKAEEKSETLELFRSGQIDVLVSTTVIEVGVNVPSATVMVIEGAERFGLAQLHQLRGRVGRGSDKSWCFLMAEPNERLKTLTSTSDGFEIAKKDLELRGAGEFFGTRQSGAPEMPAVLLTSDGRLLEKARRTFESLTGDRENEALVKALTDCALRRFSEKKKDFARN